MRAGLRLTAVGAIVALLAGCGLGGSPLTAATLNPTRAASATAASAQSPASPVSSALAMARQDCVTAVRAFNAVAGPLQEQDGAGVAAAAEAANTDLSEIGVEDVGDDGAPITEYPAPVSDAQDLLGAIAITETPAVLYEDGQGTWSAVTPYELEIVGDFKALDSACSAIGVTIGGGDSQPAATLVPSAAASAQQSAYSPSTASNPYSVGCPTSSQLFAAWSATSTSVQETWTWVPLAGFENVECWKQWVSAEPIASENEDNQEVKEIVFMDNDGQIGVLPGDQSGMSEFMGAVCGNVGAPPNWTTKADGSTSCS